jgi:hypothetical protein
LGASIRAPRNRGDMDMLNQLRGPFMLRRLTEQGAEFLPISSN